MSGLSLIGTREPVWARFLIECDARQESLSREGLGASAISALS
jgi:hypothetical protein